MKLAKGLKFCRNFESYATAQRCKQRHRPESGIVANAVLLARAAGKFEQNSLEFMTLYAQDLLQTYLYKIFSVFFDKALNEHPFRFSKIVCKIHSNNARNSLSITAGVYSSNTVCIGENELPKCRSDRPMHSVSLVGWTFLISQS